MTAANTQTAIIQRRTMLGTILAGAIAMTGLPGCASAYPYADPVDLQVVNRDTGQALRLWRHHGRLFIAGRGRATACG